LEWAATKVKKSMEKLSQNCVDLFSFKNDKV
jgi:hypothetical protein